MKQAIPTNLPRATPPNGASPTGSAGPTPVAGPAALALYRRLFAALERAGVDCCVWKNLNELPDALRGDGNIDLYVRPGSRTIFLETLRAHGFVQAGTCKAHPWVMHWYGLDERSGTLCHLHCYFRLVTGEIHIKQYVVPIERYLDVLPAVRNALGVREMHPWLQRRLHLFRRRIKLSCLPGALLFYRERDGYRAERALLERDAATAAERVPSDGWPVMIFEPGSLRHELAAGLAYRWRFRHWSRFAPFTTSIPRYAALPLRALGKLRGWRKTLPLGPLIVVTAEEARARSLRRELDDWLGGTFRLRSFRLPDTDAATTPRRLLRRCRRRRRTLRAAVRSSAGGALAVCYGWHPSRLRETLADATRGPGVSPRTRRTLERCAAQLDDVAEPDVLLHAGGTLAVDERRGAAPVDIGDAETARRWRQAFWQALADGQP